jgi:hypothetical protein
MAKLWEVVESIRMINTMLYNHGYTHRLSYHPNKGRIEVYLLDENNYRCREYGNMTFNTAYVFTDAFYTGLSLGLLDGNL